MQPQLGIIEEAPYMWGRREEERYWTFELLIVFICCTFACKHIFYGVKVWNLYKRRISFVIDSCKFWGLKEYR